MNYRSEDRRRERGRNGRGVGEDDDKKRGSGRMKGWREEEKGSAAVEGER